MTRPVNITCDIDRSKKKTEKIGKKGSTYHPETLLLLMMIDSYFTNFILFWCKLFDEIVDDS